MIQWIEANLQSGRAFGTAALLVLVLSARWMVILRLKKAASLSSDLRRRWAAQVRLATLLLILLGLMVIWGQELRAFAFSVVAIAAAIVVATKELIMCISGTLVRASGRSFQIGDRVEIGQFRGDVVDQTLLTTTILEVGPGVSIHQHTGRTVVLPNSMLLTAPVVNETFLDEYVLHAFSVPIAEDEDWREAETALLEAARTECAGFLQEAQDHMEALVRREGLEPLSVEPRVTLRFESAKSVLMLCRIAVPARRKGRIEQAIVRRMLDWRRERRRTLELDAATDAATDAAPDVAQGGTAARPG